MDATKLSPQILRAIGSVSTEGVFIYDLSSHALAYANEGLHKVMRRANGSLQGKSAPALRQCLKDDDEIISFRIKQLTEQKTLVNTEFRVNTQADVFVVCDAYLLEEQGIVVGFVKDVTKAKEHANFISEFGARKDLILDMVAHNLSGPLNLTNNILNVIDQANVSHNKTIDSHTRLIRENTQHCIEIINSFLNEEHMESKKVFVKPNPFDVLEKIHSIVSNARDFHPEKTMELICATKTFPVVGDDVKFFQVIHNLISNAIKYTASNGKITVTVTDMDDSFSVVVKDDGIGIPEHLKPYLFEKNTRAAREGLRGEKSTGFGLYIVKKLVELMRGVVTAESVENEGSVFRVILPKTI